MRECPDFAEKGSCPNTKCKLPHVIRASHRRAAAAAAKESVPKSPSTVTVPDNDGLVSDSSSTEHQRPPNANQSNIGDEYISLTFHESGESEEEDDDDEDGSDEEDLDDDADVGLEVVA